MSAQSDLSEALSAAVESGDDHALCESYTAIAAYQAGQGDADSACFFWTQALVFALSSGDQAAEAGLREKLSGHGRV